ncbi:MAG TPA: phage portal protein, partial [Aeromicrobium sp.]
MSILPFAGPALVQPFATDEEADLVNRMVNKLSLYEASNALKLAYYEGEQRVRALGIAVPPNLARVKVIVGWAGTVVDVLEERLDWQGWRSDGNPYGLDEIYSANSLALDSGKAHLDALIYGTSFAVVGSGDVGEPNPLITVHSPRTMTGLWNARKRRLDAALSVVTQDGVVVEATLYRDNETVVFSREGNNPWTVVDRDRHNLGRPLAVQLENRPRNDVCGRSEISKAVRSYTDQGVRTMLAMEIHREFFQAPQRYALGVEAEDFTASDGTVRTGWETIMGRVWAIGRNEEGELPTVGQFTPASPEPYINQVKTLAQLLAAEASMPAHYLGFQTDNPASADAIRAGESRLVKRAERRQLSFGQSWLEVARLAMLVRDGRVPDGFDATVSAKWGDPATPTRSAAADEAVKLVGGGILPADSTVTMDRLGFSPDEQKQLAS